MSTWTAEFRLSITRALADQLEATLEPLQAAVLNEANLAAVQARPGVYCLFQGADRMYVGKAARSLLDRLTQHRRKLSGRTGLTLDAITFVCVYVDEDLDAAAPEKLLIKKYRISEGIPWNTNGFGNKDPGRNRDSSKVREQHFDAIYPIDLDYPTSLNQGVQSVDSLLHQAKSSLPFLLRFDNSSGAKRIYQDAQVVIDSESMTMRELAETLVAALPEGWQLTALPGYLILYNEDRRYESALGWWRRRPSGEVQHTPGPKKFAAGAVSSDLADPDGSDVDDEEAAL